MAHTAHKHPHHDSGRLVHEFLAHSYLMYLAAVVLGFAADMVWPVRFSFPFLMPLGFILLMLGTVVVLWAQLSAHKGSPERNGAKEDLTHHHFKRGPYLFTRTPTQYGLSFLVLGLAFIDGSFFLVTATVVAFIVARFVFVPQQEKHLAHKYGDAYLQYKKHVKF